MSELEPWSGDRHLELVITLHWVVTGLFGLAWLFSSFTIGIELWFVSFAVLPLAALHGAAAMGLKQRENWGRIMSYIAAIMSLFSFPFGTAFGIYALIAHSKPDVKSQFVEETQ